MKVDLREKPKGASLDDLPGIVDVPESRVNKVIISCLLGELRCADYLADIVDN